MDFAIEAHHAALRSEIRSFMEQYIDHDVIEQAHQTGTAHSAAFAKAIGEAGILERATPGQGKDPVELWLLSSEMEKAATPFDSIGMVLSIAGVIAAIGTEVQKETVGRRLASGEDTVCFGLTEPDGGSDLAAISTKAERVGDQWVINGAKMWTTMAHIADWLFILTRTDSTGPRYAGFTAFIVPMDTPGITVDPVFTMSTERSNATFYDDVKVGDECVLGEVGEGWKVLSVMLGLERGMANTSALTPLLSRALDWARSSGTIDDPAVREHLAQIAIDNQVSELLTQRTVWTAASGQPAGCEGSISKVFATEAYQHHARWVQDAAAPESLLGLGQPGAAVDGWIDYDMRHSVSQTLQGGTSEINRNNIAERHLGLPRHR